MSPTACHIGLGRRRSLLLRTDVRLHSPEGVHSLHEVLQVRVRPVLSRTLARAAQLSPTLWATLAYLRLLIPTGSSLVAAPDFCWHLPITQSTRCQVLVAQGVTAVVFGVPDMGKVCTEQHVPSYLRSVDELRSAGVDKLVCLAVAEPTAVQEWAKKAGLAGDKVCSQGEAQHSAGPVTRLQWSAAVAV